MIIKKYNEGYYVTRIPKGSSSKCGKRGQKIYRNWFLVTPTFQIGHFTFPKELIGKKIRLKVEVL